MKEYLKWKDNIGYEFRLFFRAALKAYINMVERDTGRKISIILRDTNGEIFMLGYEIRHLNPTEEEKEFIDLEKISKYVM